MFTFHSKPANYTSAYINCRSNNGQLVHITTEKRTNEMTKFLKLSNELVAFVGLNESFIRNVFITSNNESLECFDFRAWALGHPPEIIRKQPSCVVLTQEASWKITSCIKKLPYICEIKIGGPNIYVRNINNSCTTKKPNNRFMPKKNLNTNF